MTKEISEFVAARISAFEKLAEIDEGALRAELAKLRRGVGKIPGDIPELWGMLFKDFPEHFGMNGSSPSREEWAAYSALTLYALHQQGKSIENKNMNSRDCDLGKAVSRLAMSENMSHEAVRRRFNALATSASIEELLWHLKSMVTLLRSKEIPLNYVSLAGDLYLFQNPQNQSSVRLGWGRSFYKKEELEVNKENDLDEIKEEAQDEE